MTPASRLALALTLPALALGACGGDDGGGSSGSLPDDPTAAVKAAADAVAGTSGFHLEGTGTDESGESRLEGDLRADGSLAMRVQQAGSTIELTLTGGAAYFRAPAAFWKANGGQQLATALGGKWVKGPAEQFGAAEFQQFLPKNVGFCLTQDIGTLSDGGEAQVDGKPVRVIKNAGDKPGSSPSELSIATEGEPFPLRLTQSGPERSGGSSDARCGGPDDGPDTTTRSEVTLTDFGADSAIAAPQGAVDLASLAGSAGA